MDIKNMPRRNKVYEMKPSELAIQKAVDEIELMGADIELTNAVNLLHEAKNKVSDFIDKNLSKEQTEQGGECSKDSDCEKGKVCINGRCIDELAQNDES